MCSTISENREFCIAPQPIYTANCCPSLDHLQQLEQTNQVPLVRIQEVEKKYGKFTALQKLSIDIMPGSHLLILGPNGAGKTTLIKSMMGILNFNGKITIGGIDVNKDPRGAKRIIGYVPQNYAFYEALTIYDHAVG